MTHVDLEDVLTRTAGPPDAVVRYADHADGVIDLHLPATRGPHPLLVLVHGGFWKQAYDRRHTRPMSAALAAAGYVVAVPEYRRVGDGGTGGWPTTAEDVAAAVTALPGLLDGLGIATTSTTCLGHSAGGHLVLWLAARGIGVGEGDRVVGLAPVADLRAAARAGLGDDAVQALLGGSPEEAPQAYDEADPMTLLGPEPACEIAVVHGSDDDIVPVRISRGLAERHPFVKLHELAGVDHFAVIDPQSTAWPEVLGALRP